VCQFLTNETLKIKPLKCHKYLKSNAHHLIDYLRQMMLFDVAVALAYGRVERRPPRQIPHPDQLYRSLHACAGPQQIVHHLPGNINAWLDWPTC